MPDDQTPPGLPPLVQTAEERYRRYHPEDFDKKSSKADKSAEKSTPKEER